MEHRGRIQAQGAGIEESESWAQRAPLTAAEARMLLQRLRARLTPAQRALRDEAFVAARRYIDQMEARGGVEAYPKDISKSFAVFESDDARVDIEVKKGRAFVPPGS